MKSIEDYPGGDDLIEVNKQIEALYELKHILFNNFVSMNKALPGGVLFKLLISIAPTLTVYWYKRTLKTTYSETLRTLKHIKHGDDV